MIANFAAVKSDKKPIENNKTSNNNLQVPQNGTVTDEVVNKTTEIDSIMNDDSSIASSNNNLYEELDNLILKRQQFEKIAMTKFL